jgi:hypothetical protein
MDGWMDGFTFLMEEILLSAHTLAMTVYVSRGYFDALLFPTTCYLFLIQDTAYGVCSFVLHPRYAVVTISRVWVSYPFFCWIFWI